MEGYVTRCYFSFAVMYGKVEQNFRKFEQVNRITVLDPDKQWRLSLAGKLADIAQEYGLQMYTCCGDYLLADSRIRKAHCVDGEILEQLYPDCSSGCEKPTRKECGCTESTDIGKYDTCPHGCIYCYANINKERAVKMNKEHDPDSAFLGYSKAESDLFLKEIFEKRIVKEVARGKLSKIQKPQENGVDNVQLDLFF